MWTPRRVALLILGGIAFFGCYLGYARSNLGVIDGLPTLPEEFRKPDKDVPPEYLPPRDGRILKMLKQAFGLECEELRRPIKVELHSRSMVLAAGDIKFIDGKVRLSPVSVAIFGRERFDGKGNTIEINTISSKVALLTFDKAVNSLQEISGRKVTAAELTDDIKITNNRRTTQRTDDLFLSIAHGPVFYQESKHLIWTEDKVYLRDDQSQPKPMEIRGTGMEVELLVDAPPKPGAPPPRKSKQDNISGVQRIALYTAVEMYLYVEANRSGMPGGDPKPTKLVDVTIAAATATAAATGLVRDLTPAVEHEKAQLVIHAPGRFEYRFGKDREPDVAIFDVPAVDAKQPPLSPQYVTVDRRLPAQLIDDHLDCKHLELHLRRKEPAPGPTKPGQPARDDRSPEQGLEIEHARATGGYKEVTLLSSSEKLHAQGNELIHDTRAQLTTLRGTPEMEANRDGSVIHATELQIQDNKPPEGAKPDAKEKSYQTVKAKGPGHVDLVDQKTKKVVNQAYWNDLLTSTRDGAYDLLELTGAARLENVDDKSSLQGDMVKIWLKPRDAEPDPQAKAEPAGPAGSRAERVEARNNVRMVSRELNIKDTSRLRVRFEDMPPTALPALAEPMVPAPEKSTNSNPPPPGEAAKRDDPMTPPPGPDVGPKPLPKETATSGMLPLATNPPAAKTEEPPRPIELSAVSVDAVVLRGAEDGKNQLKKLTCQGYVRVHQDRDPKKPEDKGLEITGSTLDIVWHVEGNEMVVTADDKQSTEDLATLKMGDLFLLGPEINIDQRENKAWVNGSGAMMLESTTTLSGGKTTAPEPLTIHWGTSMLFVGKSAIFQGDIQAEQGNGHLTCEALTVYFDRVISLKEGNKGGKGDKNNKDGQQARVEKMLCDRSVKIDEKTAKIDEKTGKPEIDPKTGKERLGEHKRIIATWVQTDVYEKEKGDDRDTNEMRGSGPGWVALIRRGGVDPLAPPDGAAPPKPGAKPPPAEEELKLTYVEFEKTLLANSKTGKAKFWGGVQVLQVPWQEDAQPPTEALKLDEIRVQLPKGALFLTADQLEVISQKTPGGKAHQQLTATRRVYVRTNEFFAICDWMHYDEGKDQIIFRAAENSRATLGRYLKPNAPPEETKAKEIIYIRSTGQFKIGSADYLGNQLGNWTID